MLPEEVQKRSPFTLRPDARLSDVLTSSECAISPGAGGWRVCRAVERLGLYGSYWSLRCLCRLVVLLWHIRTDAKGLSHVAYEVVYCRDVKSGECKARGPRFERFVLVVSVAEMENEP